MGFLEIAAAVASAGYTAYKLWRIIDEILEAKKMTRWQIISRVVNAAVQSVYDDFVREEKAGGKLSSDAKAKAKNMAYDRAIQGLIDHNLGTEELTPAELLDLIEESVMSKQARARMVGKEYNNA